jgi:ribosomal protein S18 acetylase RimI-like enzyme
MAAVTEELRVRRARGDDIPAIAPLLHLPAVGLNRMAGSRERALRIITADLERGGRDVTWVAELDGAPVGALVAYPYRDHPVRTRRFLRALLRHTPAWRWPVLAWRQWREGRRAPQHPGDWLYVDAVATERGHRRQGVATALLDRLERIAERDGFSVIALDTGKDNDAALALYRGAGFRVLDVVPRPGPPYGVVMLAKDVGASRAPRPGGPR